MTSWGFLRESPHFFIFGPLKLIFHLQWKVKALAFRLEDCMTNEQRMRITDMRNKGFGYTTIASAVGLSKDSVKAFCRSHDLTGVKAGNTTTEAVADSTSCLHCGAPLINLPGAKRKKFCNRICRQAWWNAHPEEVKRKAVYQYTCLSCGKPFTAYGNANRKYCSHACYIAYRYAGRNT